MCIVSHISIQKIFWILIIQKKKLAKENIVSNFVFYLIKFKAFVFSLEHTETSYSKWLKIQLK